MERSMKDKLVTFAAFATFVGCLGVSHFKPNVLALMPSDFRFPWNAQAASAEEKGTDGLAEEDVPLDNKCTFHSDIRHGSVARFSILKDGQIVYEEVGPPAERLKPMSVAGTASGAFLQDLTGDNEQDLMVEQYRPSTEGTDQTYLYTLYSLTSQGVRRHPTVELSKQACLKDMNHDGLYELVGFDTSFVDWLNEHHAGPVQPVVLGWDGNGFCFSQSLMRKRNSTGQEFERTVTDIEARVNRYDTTTLDGKPEKHIDLSAPFWSLLVERVYQGRAQEARKLLNAIWHDDELGVSEITSKPITRDEFWQKLWSQIDKSPYRAQIYSMNGRNS